ncbi:CG1667 [Drosophila busckii]|uniref:CG1667 n=1 Tax=Drosophila busckii TaxID=30019 RepID=A0A0M4EWG0_DROBS|nr:CG1667 [Drosophila busckii]
MFGEYIDNSIRALVAIFVADFLKRSANAFIEYVWHLNNYHIEGRNIAILKRVYTYNIKSICLAIAVVIGGLIRFGSTRILPQFLWHNSLLIYIPIYWIFILAQLNYSPLDYAHWIRDSHGLDFAEGMASNYFHGYLKIALPEENGLRKRMRDYEDAHGITFGLHRLIILIPDEMFVDNNLKGRLLENADPLETKFINRAGVNRPYKHSVYRLSPEVHGKPYYFAVEGATPMLSFFDAINSQISNTWQMREMKREIWLKFSKHLKMLVNSWPETRREVQLIIYNSHNTKGELVDVGELLAPYALSSKND